ncbi:uncharacterized protein LOC111601147 isoform X1 [Drosophila hydei]|uniref:Uncharacterized protein LOC111601147 isoform X1 n=1 Tax=Drosophila hydei TaxID=7224 RepID=A0A6J2SVX1_DROHY|nr:uncharacterized protein LOC111601147 isoform X1 [Drosophila hydei]XP_030080315.1 uncharacterized protein LOC111601147 isoform X1 [Drosophila hydei]
MIAYMKKFLFCIPLRVGNIFIGYFCIVHGFGNVWIVILKFSNLCKRLIWVWFLQSQINIIAGIVLLAVTFNPHLLNYMLPIQIVVKLSSLIIELVFYLLLTSSDLSNNIMFAYSLGSIIINLYFVIVIFSFYHETIRA